MFRYFFSKVTLTSFRPTFVVLLGLEGYGSSDEELPEVSAPLPPPPSTPLKRKRPTWADKFAWTKVLIGEFGGKPSAMVRDTRYSHMSHRRLGEYKKIGLERLEERSNARNSKGKFLKNTPSDKQSKPAFPLVEEEIHKEFLIREKDGGPRGDYWIKTRALELIELEPEVARVSFVASSGWLEKFKLRRNISNSAFIQLNQDYKSFDEFIESWGPQLRVFREVLVSFTPYTPPIRPRSMIGSYSYTRIGNVYQRDIFNIDEVPLCYKGIYGKMNRTKGNSQSLLNLLPCETKLDKRFATVIPILCADGWEWYKALHGVAPVAIIFKGKGMRLSAVEKAAVPKCVRVFWASKATWNRTVAIAFGKMLCKSPFKRDREKILWFDGLGMRDGVIHDSGHFYTEFQTALDRGNWIQQVHQPRESKWCQTVDLHVGANLKSSN